MLSVTIIFTFLIIIIIIVRQLLRQFHDVSWWDWREQPEFTADRNRREGRWISASSGCTNASDLIVEEAMQCRSINVWWQVCSAATNQLIERPPKSTWSWLLGVQTFRPEVRTLLLRVSIATQLNSTQMTQLNSVQPSQSCFCLWRHDLQTESTGSLYVHW